VDGRPYGTAGSDLKGGMDVSAGVVEVREGTCAFTLSSVDEPYGVILYRAALKRATSETSGGLYAVRAQVADALEALQAALGEE